jgi:hypothetical protein
MLECICRPDPYVFWASSSGISLKFYLLSALLYTSSVVRAIVFNFGRLQ